MNTTTTLPSGTWAIDPAATTVTVTVKKMKAITVPATLAVSNGSITVADGAVSAVDVAVDAASYTSPNKKRNEHVTSADFLDAAAHPTITFSAQLTKGTLQVPGTVEVKGRTTPVTFAISNLTIGDDSATFTAAATVDRFDLGVDKLPSFVIARELAIAVDATASPVR